MMRMCRTLCSPTVTTTLMRRGHLSESIAPGVMQRHFCTAPEQRGHEIISRPPKPDSKLPTYEELVRFPLPEGLPTHEFGAFCIKDSSRSFRDIPGDDCLLGVHGPEEEWAPRPLVDGHGACGGLFAIMAAAGTQFKVMPGDVVYTMRMPGEVNTQHVFEDVVMLGAVDWTIFGRPCIRDAVVVATVEEQPRSGKIYIEKFKKRTGYRRRIGHRQRITRFRIDEIRYVMPICDRIVPHDLGFDPTRPEKNLAFKM